MNGLSHSPFIWNEKRWYFLSLFYAREKWAELITHILLFNRERENQLYNCLISFSEVKGEHLQVVFVFPCVESNDYSTEIRQYFQTFFNKNPSISSTPFPYGKVVWGQYPNNSLAWNTFRLPDYSEQYIDFHQQTFNVTLELLEDDFSADSFISLGIYLIIKSLSCIEDKEQKNSILKALQRTLLDYPHLLYTVEGLMNDIEMDRIDEIIESYRNENASEYSPELFSWLNKVKILLKQYGDYYLYAFICEITGLKGLPQLMILELLNARYNRQ